MVFWTKEKKLRKEEEKKKQIELDRIADEKWKKEFEEEMLKEKIEKQKKMEKFQNFQKENESLVENKKRKTSLNNNYYDKI